jgi:predicted nucleotidyltransferase
MQSTTQILEQIKATVKASDPNAKVILYGSCARGDYREGSDIDILVLLDKDKITNDDRERICCPYTIYSSTRIFLSARLSIQKQTGQLP